MRRGEIAGMVGGLMRRFWLVLLTLLMATVLSGCPVFTRDDGADRGRPTLAGDGQGDAADE